MNTFYILILLYLSIGVFIGQAGVMYAKDKYRPWHYWPKYWAMMLIGWPGFIWAIKDNARYQLRARLMREVHCI